MRSLVFLCSLIGSAWAVRLCVTGRPELSCHGMFRDPRVQALDVQCVYGRDQYQCLKHLWANNVDLVRAEPSDVYLAHQIFDTQLSVIAHTRASIRSSDPHKYEGVAVVRRDKIRGLPDLRGAKSCHTGYQRTAGWFIPISMLLQRRVLEMDCDPRSSVVEHDIKTASSFFSMACLPGQWAPNNSTDRKLKHEHRHLCELCANPTLCGEDDVHSGYIGALRCLVDAFGDVAWTRLEVVPEFFRQRGGVLRSKRVRPPLNCVVPKEADDCMAIVQNKGADVTTADGGDIFSGGRSHYLVPVLSESKNYMDASYFVVAVVKSGSGIRSLADLRGKRSCHTGIGRPEGWKVPIGALLEAGLLRSGDCDYPRQISQFFSSSCVPGALDPLFNTHSRRENLCALCVGSPNGNSNASWARGLRTRDFHLLCRYSSYSEVYKFHRCHLARVPARKIVTSYSTTAYEMDQIRILFLRASDLLPAGQDSFTLFGPFDGINNLIFEDTTTELVNIPDASFYRTVDDRFYKLLRAWDTCNSAPHYVSAWMSVVFIPAIFISLFA